MIDFLIQYGYIGVFLAAFLAATVLPFGSEPVVVGVLAAGAEYVPVLVAATIGNFLGGMSCYWLGWLGKTLGLLKARDWPVAFWMFLGKFLRYLVVFGAFDWIAGLLAAA